MVTEFIEDLRKINVILIIMIIIIRKAFYRILHIHIRNEQGIYLGELSALVNIDNFECRLHMEGHIYTCTHYPYVLNHEQYYLTASVYLTNDYIQEPHSYLCGIFDSPRLAPEGPHPEDG